MKKNSDFLEMKERVDAWFKERVQKKDSSKDNEHSSTSESAIEK